MGWTCDGGLTVFDFAEALIRDRLLLFHVAYQRNEWIERVSELPCEAQHLLHHGTGVALADRIGGEAHELAGEIREAEQVAVRGNVQRHGRRRG